MNKWCYYNGGKLLGPENSKTIAKLLLKGNIDPHDKVLNMHNELWEPVSMQQVIMAEYQKLKQQGKSTSRGTYISDSDSLILGDSGRLADNFANTIMPNRYLPFFFGIVMILWYIWSFLSHKLIKEED